MSASHSEKSDPCTESMNEDHDPRNLAKRSSNDSKPVQAGKSVKVADKSKSNKLSDDMRSLNLGSAPTSMHDSSAWSPAFTKGILQYQFDASSPTDKVPCCLKSTLKLKNLILIADYDNHKIKGFDKDTREFLFDTQVESAYDMTEISENVIAATSGQRMYFTMFTLGDHGLSEIRKVLTEYECWGICYNDDRVYVMCCESDPQIAEVHVYTKLGHFIERFEPVSEGQKVLRAPSYIAVNPQDEVLYMGNYETETVVAMTLTGELLFARCIKISGRRDYDMVLGVATGKSGELYVSGLNTNNVIAMSPDAMQAREIISNDVKRLQCIRVQENEMIVCRQDTNYVNVFKLTNTQPSKPYYIGHF